MINKKISVILFFGFNFKIKLYFFEIYLRLLRKLELNFENKSEEEWSRSVLCVSFFWFVTGGKIHTSLDFLSQPLRVFYDILEVTYSFCTVVLIVANTVVNGITRCYNEQPQCEKDMFNAKAASFSSLHSVTKFALMTNWGAKSPPACTIIKGSKTARFASSPYIIECSKSARRITTETEN